MLTDRYQAPSQDSEGSENRVVAGEVHQNDEDVPDRIDRLGMKPLC
jgi:hypothetical protein